MYDDLLGVVLCGGQAKRMNGADKGLVTFNKRPMASYSIDALIDCKKIIINANRNKKTYQKLFNLPVIMDISKNHQGPLSGILAALFYARKQKLTWLMILPCDAPYITRNYVQTIYKQTYNNTDKIFMASDAEGFYQPVFALVHLTILKELQYFLQSGQKKALLFYQQIGFKQVKFNDNQLFTNINTHADGNLKKK